MRELDLDALQIFKTVAEEGGITRAAAKLHRFQSNVTTRVKQLEARLGTRLFLRHNRKLVLSAEGKVLLAYAERLLRLSSEAEAALRDGTPRGISHRDAGKHCCDPAVPHPLALSSGLSGTPDRARDGHDRRLDCPSQIEAAFVAEPFIATNLDSQPAFNEKLVLIAPGSFPRIRTPKDIGRATLIAFGAGCTYRRCLEDWLARAKVAPGRVMEFNSYHAIVACVAVGAGVAMVPQSVIRTVPAGRDVAVYPLPAEVSNTRTMLVWHQGYRSIALEALQAQLGRGKK